MAEQTLVDTDILIDAAKEQKDAVSFPQGEESHRILAVSVVTEMELVVGCRDRRELKNLEMFLKRFRVIPVGEGISTNAIALLKTYRLSHGLLIADALIASTALCLGVNLATKNRRDFVFIEGLKLVAYP